MRNIKIIIQSLILVLLIVACGSPEQTTPTSTPIPETVAPTERPPTATASPPISEIDSQELHREWGFLSALTGWGTMRTDSDGKITIDGDIAVDIIMTAPPKMSWVEEEGGGYFQFEKAPPRGESPAVVIFTTSEYEDGDAAIPRFTPTIGDKVDSTTYLTAGKVDGFEGRYDFQFGMASEGFNFFLVDSNLFYEGSQHHIYGDVTLFGVDFNNDSEDPLVFQIEEGKYVYSHGQGNATTDDGRVIIFGQ